jgi:hypothetical protein
MRGIKILSQLPCLYSLPALVLHCAARDLFVPLNQTHFFELFKKYINKLILIFATKYIKHHLLLPIK